MTHTMLKRTEAKLDRNDNHDGLVGKGEWTILRLFLKGVKNKKNCEQVTLELYNRSPVSTPSEMR